MAVTVGQLCNPVVLSVLVLHCGQLSISVTHISATVKASWDRDVNPSYATQPYNLTASEEAIQFCVLVSGARVLQYLYLLISTSSSVHPCLYR